MKNILYLVIPFYLGFFSLTAIAQSDTTTTEEEEDYSIYDNLDFVDEAAKRYAAVKIKGVSPQKLITIGYDYQGGYDMEAGNLTDLNNSSRNVYLGQTAKVNSTQGIRLEANIPVISKNSLIVQVGARFWDINYDFDDKAGLSNPVLQTLSDNNLTSLGLNTTIYKPINETSFLLFKVDADMSGDFDYSEFQPLKYNRYSVAALWGKRPSDNKQWAIGLSRTYRAGEMNYLPVLLYNWTSINNTWGAELLLPAKAHLRYTLNPRNMLFVGFELEGNSFRIGNQGFDSAIPNDPALQDLELRRSEIRFRLMYERQITGFVWLSAQAGYRYDYSFNVDQVKNGDDFFRGFFGDQPFASENSLTNPLYFNISINLVSP
tara:strand:- start:3063 stop:4187 length:1125 start_codon:yes stop_codon:yes gene_type:complete